MLVSLGLAKAQLRIEHDHEDEYIVRLVGNASLIVTQYLKVADDEYDSDLPRDIEQAILLVIENLYDRPDQDPLSPAVVSLLHRRRDPAIA